MVKKKQKRYYRRTIDLLFLLVLLIVCILSFYAAFTFGMLPRKWIFMLMALFGIIYLILFVVSLKKMPTWFVVIKRIFIIMLVVLLATSGYFIDRSKKTVANITKTNSGGTSEIYVIAKKDSSIATLDDLSGKIVGYQSGIDKKNADFVKQEIESKVSNTTPVEEIDYTTLSENLENGQINALVISDNFYNMTKANMEGFGNSVKTIKTYSKKNEVVKQKKDIAKDVFTVYLSGLDNAGSPDQTTRSDTNLLLIINPISNHIDMVSLPRDGYIPNPALKNANDKLTHTAMYGIDNSVNAIQTFFNIPIDYYARVSFTSLAKIVDTIGGIDVDVELDVCAYDESTYRTTEENQKTHEGQKTVCIKKGPSKLNGAQALIYARHRKTEGYDNPGRERAQQRIIKGIINKLLSPNGLIYAQDLMTIVPNFVITNMPNDQITSFISSELGDLKPWSISSLASDTGVYDSQYVASLDPANGYSDVYLFNKEEIHSIVNAYDAAQKQLQLDTFNFNVTNLYKNTPEITNDPSIVWDTMARDPH
ncbi:MAG: LCP family protein [Longicatena sp.]